MRAALVAGLLLGCSAAPVPPDGGPCYFDPRDPPGFFTYWRDDGDGGVLLSTCFYMIDCRTALGCGYVVTADAGWAP